MVTRSAANPPFPASIPYYNRKPDTTTRNPILQLGLDCAKPKPPYHNQPTSLHFAWFPI